jgi:peptidoglycan hydrolase CwlO-like protein
MRSLRAVFFAVVLCASIMPARLFADTTADQRAQLQAQLDAINQEIKSNQTTLTQLQLQRSSYERDVAILDSKIQAAQLAIKARNLTIQGLKADIAAKQKGIGTLDTKVAAGQASLAQILRETRALDDLSIAELALGGSLSDLFQEIDDFQTIQRSLGDAFTEMAAVRSDLSARKKALEDQQQEEQDLLQIQVLQQNALKATQKQKQDLVNTVKGQESRYQQIISGKQQTAAQIQAALFALAGGSRQVSFGDIYTFRRSRISGKMSERAIGAPTCIPPATSRPFSKSRPSSGSTRIRCRSRKSLATATPVRVGAEPWDRRSSYPRPGSSTAIASGMRPARIRRVRGIRARRLSRRRFS